MINPVIKLSAVLIFLIFSFSKSYSNNGAIAYAYPIKAITIDGNLSDWPSDMTYYPIKSFSFGTALKGEDDVQARFRIGYNLKARMLYVAVEATDDAHLGDHSEDAEWNTHDMHNFYVDMSHDVRGSAAISHLVSPDYRRIAEKRPQEYWDPQVREASWDNVQVKIKREGTLTIYEWSFFMGEQLRPGRSIGFDYEVIDKDPGEEGFPSVLAWSPGVGKGFNTGNVGDVILMRPQDVLGTLKGKVHWKDKANRQIPRQIIISASDNPNLWVTAKVDSSGNYSVDLPVGSYQLALPFAVFYDENKAIRMNTDKPMSVYVKKKSQEETPAFVIEPLTKPKLIPKKGVLTQFTPTNKSDVDRFMQVFMEYYNVPGASLALVKESKVVYYKTYGYKNAYIKEKVDERTLFEAASVTKPVFAFAVNRLVERGEFDLDKPLCEYLAFEEIAEDERYKLMTGRHVLTHKSGLPNWGRYMIETPGAKLGYSGEGFEYLKRAVAHVTQRDIENLVSEEVLKPLGLSHTYFSKNESLMQVVAHGHYGNRPTLFDVPTEPGMAHSMYTEALTFTQFMIALLERKGLKAATYEEMFRPQTEMPADPAMPGWKESFGLGIAVMATPFGNAYGHGGNNGDFRCQFEIFDEGKMGFALFTNGSNGHQLVNALREFLITGKLK